jgi:hypothetical protein
VYTRASRNRANYPQEAARFKDESLYNNMDDGNKKS